MSQSVSLLNTRQMARFAARGYLRFDGIVPDDINEQFIAEAGHVEPPSAGRGRRATMQKYAALMRANDLEAVAPGTPLQIAYASDSALGRIVRLPEVRGAIESLVGPGSIVDHHFLHITFPPEYYQAIGADSQQADSQHAVSQNTHQDSTIDPRQTFDVQIFYFPHDVTPEMGGTRFVPGTHLRIVSEAAIGRYQNILGQQHVVCPAGTLIFMHHGMWHGGGVNRSDTVRYMFKIRLNPTVRQQRLWDTHDLNEEDFAQSPIFFIKNRRDADHVHSILTTPEPWFEQDTGRLEYINRIRFWRFLLGDERFDADYWVTRIENEPATPA